MSGAGNHPSFYIVMFFNLLMLVPVLSMIPGSISVQHSLFQYSFAMMLNVHIFRWKRRKHTMSFDSENAEALTHCEGIIASPYFQAHFVSSTINFPLV